MTTATNPVPTSSVAERVVTRLTELLGRAPGSVSRDDELSALVAESFALVELAIELQDEFATDLTQDDLKHARTVGQLADLIASRAPA